MTKPITTENPEQIIAEEIENTILNYTEHATGLGIIESPTGTGKSYNCCKAITKILFNKIINGTNKPGENKINKIIYLTPEKKHIPISTLRKIMKQEYARHRNIAKFTDQEEQDFTDLFNKEVFVYRSKRDSCLNFMKKMEEEQAKNNYNKKDEIEKIKKDINTIYNFENKNNGKAIDFYRDYLEKAYEEYKEIQEKLKGKNNLWKKQKEQLKESCLENLDEQNNKLMKQIAKYIKVKATEESKEIIQKYKNKEEEEINNLKNARFPAQENEEYLEKCKEIEEKYKKAINNEIKNLKINLILNKNNKYHLGFVKDYYPRAITTAHIIFMSLSKFMTQDNPLISETQKFDSEEWMKNSKIIIDEIDECKKTMWDAILEKQKMYQYDLTKAENATYKTLQNIEYKSKNTLEAISKKGTQEDGKYQLKKLKNEYDNIRKKYSLMQCYKTNKKDINTNKTVIINDGAYYTLSDNPSRQVAYCKKNQDEQNVTITMLTISEYKEADKSNGFALYNVITDITRNLKNYSRLIIQGGKEYAHKRNEENQKNKDINDNTTMMTENNGINSIMDAMQLDRSYRNLIDQLGEKVYYSKTRQASSKNYINKISVLFLEDSQDHNETTGIKNIYISEIPEKILLQWAEKAMVIGISATAKVKSYTNYYQDFLKESLGNTYYDDIDKEKIQKAENRINENYKNKEINLELIVEDINFNRKDEGRSKEEINRIKNKAKQIMEKHNVTEEKQEKICEYIDTLKDESELPYKKAQNFNFFLVMLDFYLEKDMQTLLCFSKSKPTDKGKEIIENIDNILKNRNTREELKIYDITTENYDNQVKNIKKAAEAGTPKIIIRTAYQTAGRGINLVYKPPKNMKSNTITLNSEFAQKGKEQQDDRYINKDIDAIYLDQYTHNYAIIENENEEEELLKAIIDIEQISAMNEISQKTKEEMLQDYYELYNGNLKSKQRKDTDRNTGTSTPVYGKMKQLPAVKRNMNMNIIQAIGRLERTFVRNKHQKIYIARYNLEILDYEELNGHILSPLMKAITDAAEQLDNKSAKIKLKDKEKRKKQKENNRCERTAQRNYEEWSSNFRTAYNKSENNEISKEQKESVEIYEASRELALKYPTAESEELEEAINKEIEKRHLNPENIHLDAITTGWIHRETPINSYSYRNETRPQLDFTNTKNKEVNFENSGMKELQKIKGMKEWFEENSIPMVWEPKHNIITPKMFDLYKGILGEMAYKYIGKEIGYEMEDLPDEEFEVFDGRLVKNRYVYIDIKNWANAIYDKKENEYLKHVKKKLEHLDQIHQRLTETTEEDIEKMKKIGFNPETQEGINNKKYIVKNEIPASKVILINVYPSKSENAMFEDRSQHKIITIGSIINTKGEINLSAEEFKILKNFAQKEN